MNIFENKNNFVENTETDMMFLKNIIKISKLFGVTAYEFCHRKGMIYVFNGIFLIIYFWQTEYYYSNQFLELHRFDITGFLGVCSGSLQLIFSVLCLYSNKSTTNHLKKILTNINEIDSKFRKERIIIKNISKTHIHLTVEFLILHIPLLVLVFTLDWISFKDILSSLVYSVMFYQRYNVILIFNNSVSLLEKRSVCTERYLKRIFHRNQQNMSTWSKDNIKKLKEIVCLIDKNVKQVNHIFGFQILFIIIGAFVDVLNVFSFCIKSPLPESRNIVFVVLSSILFGAFLPVSI